MRERAVVRWGGIVLPLVLLACATTPPAPVGTAGASLDQAARWWVPEFFFVGRGEGGSLAAASDAARADLARTVAVRVTARTATVERFVRVRRGDAIWSQHEASVEDAAVNETDVLLEGATIRWSGREGERHLAVAVLDRGEATRRLAARAEVLDGEIDAAFQRGVDPATPVRARIGAMRRALKALVLRAALVERGVQVSALPGPPSPASQEQVLAALEDAQAALVVAVVATGAQGPRVQATLAEALDRLGFATTTGGSAPLRVEAEVVVEDAGLDVRGRALAGWRVTCRLVDVERRGSVLGTRTALGREGHLSVEGARERAFQEVEKAIRERLAREVMADILAAE